MTNLEIITESFRGLLAQACLYALIVVAGLYAINKFLELLRPSLSRLWRESRMGLAALALLSLAMGLWADKTNLLRMIIHPGGPPVVVVSAEDILRGFR